MRCVMDIQNEFGVIFKAIDESIKIRNFELESCISDLEKLFKTVEKSSLFNKFILDKEAREFYEDMKKNFSIGKEIVDDLKDMYEEYVDNGEIELGYVLEHYKKVYLIFEKLDDMRGDLSRLNSTFNILSSN
jgi:hypothetical protein